MYSLAQILFIIIDIVWWIVIAQVVLSWLISFSVVSYSNRIVAQIALFLDRVTEPMLAPIRRILPNFGAIDLSPLVLLLGLSFLKIIIALVLLLGLSFLKIIIANNIGYLAG